MAFLSNLQLKNKAQSLVISEDSIPSVKAQYCVVSGHNEEDCSRIESTVQTTENPFDTQELGNGTLDPLQDGLGRRHA